MPDDGVLPSFLETFDGFVFELRATDDEIRAAIAAEMLAANVHLDRATDLELILEFRQSGNSDRAL
jgi:hypothetical protein